VRVANYLRRRGLEEEPTDASSNFEFDFDSPLSMVRPAHGEIAGNMELSRQDRDAGLDAELRPEALQSGETPDHEGAQELREDTAEWAQEPLGFGASESPVEIVLDSGRREAVQETVAAPAPSVAPLGHRFAAGLLDALVLLIAGGEFFALFRASGGRVDRQPTSLAVLAFAVAFLGLFYFSIFTALAFATPGQSAVGLRVRTFDGETPDVRTAIWRGAGYLISAASLMLGFVWAALDPDHLAWHDRMSGTCLVKRD
jgi:uncharacterized RDD family membrane protein YckC